MTNTRNIAIIAHVDHGKTTLVDGLLKQTHTFRDNQAEMSQTTILDSGDLEREKGITILAKNTSVVYRDTKINIIDTPGHADFGGEVERVLNMADGALLIVDAAEGPLPQTKFVLQKAIQTGLKIILVINKIDKKDARPAEILSQTEELFLRLANDPTHLDFPVVYAVGREGKAWYTLPDNPASPGDLTPIFETILQTVPPPRTDPDKPFKMLISSLDFDSYQGRYAIGKITQGRITQGQQLVLTSETGENITGRAEKLFIYQGLKKVEVNHIPSGEIAAVTGFNQAKIGFTLADPADPTPLPTIRIEEPTIKITVGPNTSPLAGKEGKFYTARQIQDRLHREKESNIGMIIEENSTGTGFVVSGRGELHLAVLLETLRREGFELEVGKPQVIFKEEDKVGDARGRDPDSAETVNSREHWREGERVAGPTLFEPYEELTIEIPSEFVGIITTEMGQRKGELLDLSGDDRGNTRMLYKISSRNLLGFRNSILSSTRGTGIFASVVIGYAPVSEASPRFRNGVLIATEAGQASGYALNSIQERATMFIGPGTQVYEGMIVGLNSREDDIDVNVCKEKTKTNVRASTKDMGYVLTPPRVMSLEQNLDFLEDDEILEITPQSLRLRKKLLTKVDRVRASRSN